MPHPPPPLSAARRAASLAVIVAGALAVTACGVAEARPKARAAETTAAVPSPEALSAAMDARLYKWPTAGTISFTLRTSALDATLQEAEAAAATDPDARVGLELLRGLTIVGGYDFATGVVTTEVKTATPVTDATRAGGLQQVRHGVYEMVSGLMSTLDLHRSSVIRPETVAAVRRDGAAYIVEAKEGGATAVYRVDAASMLPSTLDLTTPDSRYLIEWADWQEAGPRSLIGKNIIKAADGTVLAALSIAYQAVQDIPFPSRVDATSSAGTVTMWLSDLVFVAG